MRVEGVAGARVRATRDVSPDDLADLLSAPPRASLAWIDAGSVRVAPVSARHDGGSWQVRTDPSAGADLGAHDVVLVVDDGPGWFQLRSVTVRGSASAPGQPPARWSIHPRRVVAWDYGRLRLTHADDAPAAFHNRIHAMAPTVAPPAPQPLARGSRPVVRRARVLLLATASARPRPFCVPLWFVYHRGRFWIATGAGSWSARNVAGNAEVRLLLGGEGRDHEPRVRIAGHAVCRRGLPPLRVLARIAFRYYLAPRRAWVELGHWRQWGTRQRYYSQTEAGPAYLVVTPTRVEVLSAPGLGRTG